MKWLSIFKHKNEQPQDEQRDPDYCWTHGKIERQEDGK
jgi:hypothetical protein